MGIAIAREHGDALDAASDDGIDTFIHDLMSRNGDSLQAGRTETIDGGASNGSRKACQHGGSSPDVLALCSVRLAAAQDYVFNFRSVKIRSFAQDIFNAVSDEVFRTGQIE